MSGPTESERPVQLRDNPMVAMADEAERPTRWWLAWLVALIIILVGLVLGDWIGALVLGHPARDQPRAQFLELFMFGTIALLLYLWIRLKERRGFSTFGFRGSKPVGRLLLGLLLGAALMTLGVLVPVALGDLATGRSEHHLSGTGALLMLVPLLVVFVLQSSTEEMVFRGYMLPMGLRQLPGWVAVLGTSVIFAAIHPGANVVGTLNILLYAVFACLVVLQQGSLWLICGFHAGWNFFQGNVYGVPVSGNPEPTSLFTFGPTSGSRDLLSGGDFGIEASLVGTVLLVLAVAVAWVALRRTRGGTAAPAEAAPADAGAGT